MCGAYGFSVKDAKEVYDRFEVVNQLGAPGVIAGKFSVSSN